MLFLSILHRADGNGLWKYEISNLFVFSYDRCGFLDLQLCDLQLPPEHFLQLRAAEQHDKKQKIVREDDELAGHDTMAWCL